jgi:hypothetical protein
MPLHQRRNVTVFRATNEFTFPMAGNGAVLDFCGSFPDGDGIYDLTARVFKDARVLRAAYAALGSQVPDQLFFQHSAGFNSTRGVTMYPSNSTSGESFRRKLSTQSRNVRFSAK